MDITAWAEAHNCKFGVPKFQLMDMTRRRMDDPEGGKKRITMRGETILIGGRQIVPKTCTKFLGVIIDAVVKSPIFSLSQAIFSSITYLWTLLLTVKDFPTLFPPYLISVCLNLFHNVPSHSVSFSHDSWLI